jgi:hypothetical protein
MRNATLSECDIAPGTIKRPHWGWFIVFMVVAVLWVRFIVSTIAGSDFGGGGSGCDGRFGPSEEGTRECRLKFLPTMRRDIETRLPVWVQRANIMHLVDLKRGGYSPRRTEMRIGRLTARPQSISILSKSVA